MAVLLQHAVRAVPQRAGPVDPWPQVHGQGLTEAPALQPAGRLEGPGFAQGVSPARAGAAICCSAAVLTCVSNKPMKLALVHQACGQAAEGQQVCRSRAAAT